MRPPPSEAPWLAPYQGALGALLDRAVPFVLIGSAALRLRAPRWPCWPKDLDLVAPADPPVLEALAEALESAGYALSLWGEPLARPLSMTALRGKFYLRALHRTGGQVVDATYECLVPWQQLSEAASEVAGLRVAGAEHLLALKQARGRPEDLQAVEQLRTLLALR